MAGEVATEELPKAVVRRVVKEKLSKLSTEGDMNLHKEALNAFTESARIFIHYLSATANDLCKESGRQTINAEDVLKALEEIEFPEFSGPLRTALNEFRKKKAGKRESSAKTKEPNKKRKPDKEMTLENGEIDAEKGNENDSNEENNEDDDTDQCLS
ncbi:hypothetical protein V2J09_000020 [Rumex salicifolius]